jgi:hypothetical protein
MPIISQIDRNSDAPIRRFIGNASNYRLQLAAIPDTRDPQTGQILKGEHIVAQFKRGLFETNRPELIELIEKSYSYGSSVKDYDVLLKEGKDKKYESLLAMAKDDPELLERLKKDLAKKATVAQKKEAAAVKASLESEASSHTA